MGILMFSAVRVDPEFEQRASLSTEVRSRHSPKPKDRLHLSPQCIFQTRIRAFCHQRKSAEPTWERPFRATAGPASSAMPEIVRQLNSSGLHFAFLDPHNLGTLSFDLFMSLAKLKRIDIIVHVSLSDLQRNADRYTSVAHDQFDRFAPGWRDHIRTDVNQNSLRAAILQYWSDRVMALGLPRAEHCELIKGTQNQRLYWLAFLSKHDLAHTLWSKISSSAKAPDFDF